MGAKKTIIVIGGAHGGPSAVSFARQANENARIILVEQAPFATWIQADLSRYLADEADKVNDLIRAKESYFKNRYNVDVRLETKALSLDLDSRVVTVDCKGKIKRLAFDSVVFAGGAMSVNLDIAGLSGPRVTHYRTLNDIEAIKKAKNEGAKKAVVVGCGFYGLEATLGLLAAGFSVSVLEINNRICPKFSLAFSERIYEKVVSLGVDIKLGTSIAQARPRADQGFSLELSNGEFLDADLVVVCIGLKPRTAFLANAGAALDDDGSIRVDEKMATTLPNVYACGSAVSVPHAVTNERKWIPQAGIILRSAQVAGRNAALDSTTGHDVLKPFCGTLMIQVADMRFARTGLDEQEAKSFFGEENIISTTVFGSSCESFIAEKEMCVKLLVEKQHSRIVGGEVFGELGVERRIDLISVCVAQGWTPQNLIDLDMSYSSDSGQIFDVIKEAAFRAKNGVSDESKTLTGEKLALWLAKKQDFNLVNVSDGPLLSGYLAKRTKNIPLEDLRARLKELSENDLPIVLYSKSGYRSYLALHVLNQRGLRNVYHLDGGISTLKLVVNDG